MPHIEGDQRPTHLTHRTQKTCPAHRREVGGQRRGHVLRTPQDLAIARNLPARASTSRASLHSSRLREQPVTSCATGCVIHYATPRRKQNEILCVRSLRSHVAGTRLRHPASSHKIAFCLLRPPGARPPVSALRLSTPLGLNPSRGSARWSGLRRLAQLARLPVLRGLRSSGMRRHSWQASRQASRSLSLSRLLRLVPP